MTSLSTCLSEASSYWASQADGPPNAMYYGAKLCVEIVGPDKRAEALEVADARKLLGALARKGLSRKSVRVYYGAFKRLLTLNGITPKQNAMWPRAPTPPRKTREAITPDDYSRMVDWLVERNFGETADLAKLLSALGARVQVEVLQAGNLRTRLRDGHLLVHVTGKGEHERWVPCTDIEAKAILRDKHLMSGIRAIPYKTHLWRWNEGRRLLEIKGLATFHAIRHKYATEVLGRTNNLRLVQDLLGHSNPATTAIYTHVGLDEKVRALTTE